MLVDSSVRKASWGHSEHRCYRKAEWLLTDSVSPRKEVEVPVSEVISIIHVKNTPEFTKSAIGTSTVRSVIDIEPTQETSHFALGNM